MYRVGDMRPPTLDEVIQDPDFLDDFMKGNPFLLKFMDSLKLYSVLDYIIKQPKYADSPERCFKLPLIVCEVFMTHNWVIVYNLFGIDDETLLKNY